jgi:thioredoxin-like negative regulator of GroEL
MSLPRTSIAAGLVVCLLALGPAAEAAGRREARREYLEILGLWAQGSRDEAAERLANALTGSAGSERTTAVGRAVKPTARRLARNLGTAALLPVALLHEEAYALRVREQPRRASAVLRPALELLSIFEAEARTADERAAVSALLTSLAGRMAEAHVERPSRELVRSALRADPTNRAAHLALASSAERFGDHAAVVRSLRALLRLDPGHRESRLRLSLNLMRTGEEDEGLEELRRLVAEGGRADWIAAVARQELARHLVERGEMARARDVLAAMPERRLPDPALAVQTAFVAERAGGGEVEDLFAALSLAAAGSEAPSRTSYLRTPNDLLEEIRRDLLRRGEEQSTRLAVFLRNHEPALSAR